MESIFATYIMKYFPNSDSISCCYNSSFIEFVFIFS